MNNKQKMNSDLQRYQICQACGIVDQDKNRVRTGYPCPNCEKPSKGGLMFLNLQTQMLINLIADIWQKRTENGDSKSDDLTIIIFYCTLQEILMQVLLESCMWASSVPHRLIEKTLSDNKFISKRVESLFPVLTQKKFRDAVIEEMDSSMGEKILDVWGKAIETRNNFMHRGDQWNIPEDLPESCWTSILSLCELFVRLNNKYATKTKS